MEYLRVEALRIIAGLGVSVMPCFTTVQKSFPPILALSTQTKKKNLPLHFFFLSQIAPGAILIVSVKKKKKRVSQRALHLLH
jgi:hypothetical protein